MSVVERTWTLAVCATCGERDDRVKEDACPTCGSEAPPRLVAVVPADTYRGAVEVLRWLTSMDDPDDAAGLEARRTVTLTAIIDRARAALGGQ